MAKQQANQEWQQSAFSKDEHAAKMENRVLTIISYSMAFVGFWAAIAYFCDPGKGMQLLNKLLPIITLFIGYLANDAVKNGRKR